MAVESRILSDGLSASDLTLFRGERCLFQGVSFSLLPGQLLVLEGANGSGKTSLLKAIVGMLELDSGDIAWQGKPVRDERQAFHASLVWTSHRTGLKADLTLMENLNFEATLRPQRTDIDIDAVLDRLGIAGLRTLPLRSLSAGQQRRVALARVLLADVPLWLMDEPFTNLDRDGRALVSELIDQHVRNQGLCVIAAHQDVDIGQPMQKIAL